MKLSNVCKIGQSHYFRRKIRGKHFYRRLPDPTDRRFKRAYEIASRDLERVKTGLTLSALIDEYERSPAYRQLAFSTKRSKDTYFKLFRERFPDVLVDDIKRYDVYEMQTALEDTPGLANGSVAQLSALLNFGIDREFCAENVASNIKRLKEGSHLPWPSSVVARALEAASPMVRLAIITGLESGQRIGDCIRITHVQVETGLVELTQQKTGTMVFIPVSKKWADEIARVRKSAATILVNQRGKPFRSTESLQSQIRQLMQAVGAPGYTFHGLRKNATNRLAESGFTPFQIAAVTGMTLPTIVHYTRDVDARRLAMGTAGRRN